MSVTKLYESEEWRVIPGFEDYEASSEGRIRRSHPDRYGRGEGLIRRPTVSDGGYLNVTLLDASNSKRLRGVHVFVALAFHGPKPSNKHHAAHGDGNRKNNKATNLRWATAKDNYTDRALHGTLLNGEMVNTVKLTAEQVLMVREVLAIRPGYKRVKRGRRTELAKQLGVHSSTIGHALKNRSWKHLKQEVV